MANNNVRVVFDRRKKAQETGKGWVEICIYLQNRVCRYIKLVETTPMDWPIVRSSLYVQEAIAKYEHVRCAMEVMGEPITLETLDKHLGVVKKAKAVPVVEEEVVEEKPNFLDYIAEAMKKERTTYGTMKHKLSTLKMLKAFGKIQLMSDLTPTNLIAFDKWLRETGQRTDVTIHNYHKHVRMYSRQVYQQGYIKIDPYTLVHFTRGKSKERQPLTEDELAKLRDFPLRKRQAKARDLFIFAAYTGLAYCDTQLFDFKTMTEEHDGLYYIDGSRLKTGTKFFTPIFPPAMKVLKKYDFKLPRMSNQKLNEYLHDIEDIMQLNKPLTFHVARHSFATLTLAHDIPIENVARMLGHTDIRTTKIYAKTLKETIERHALSIVASLK